MFGDSKSIVDNSMELYGKIKKINHSLYFQFLIKYIDSNFFELYYVSINYNANDILSNY